MQDGTFDAPSYLKGTRPAPDVLRGDVFARDCPTRQLLDRVGDKWSVLILRLLGEAPMRFSLLKRRIAGISQKMLSQTLRSLERDGLLTRHAEATVPITVTYSITPLGHELLAALRAMIDWAETRMPAVAQAQQIYDART
ncbi:winged helix-turn-helix transcriptional regulator [Sphingomonas sp. MMS12-HWE2-04]|uniref:winged helix-turn-helix transcriptional regulator n=1 Tax=Sphingomonas sp. MMS12-HWE2-04 TaxID=3234199 RepID=UPI0038511165